MGLAGERKRTKISHDPNNTTWGRSADNYGHRIMRSQGWTPGSYLGASNATHAQNFTSGSASYVRAILKDDNLGLGAKPHSKKAEDEPTGLDAFQDLLGRLNGKSDAELETEQRRRGDVKLLSYVEKRWKSMNFVKGGLLVQEKMPRSSVPKEVGSQGESAGSQDESSVVPKKKKKRKERTKERDSDRTELKDRTSEDDKMKERPSKSKDKKDKKDKKKRSKDRKMGLSEPEISSGDTAKSKKRKRKEKDKIKEKPSRTPADSSSSSPTESDEGPTPSSKSNGALVVSRESRPGRQVLRARHIRQKKAALMDDKSLNEIFMARS